MQPDTDIAIDHVQAQPIAQANAPVQPERPTPRRGLRNRVPSARARAAAEDNARAQVQRPAPCDPQPRQEQFRGRQFPPRVEAFSLGAMTQLCAFCSALKFSGEVGNRKLTKCCQSGKVTLPPLAPYPPELRILLSGDNPDSRHFLDFIRQYNSSMAFASFVANTVVPPRRLNGGP